MVSTVVVKVVRGCYCNSAQTTAVFFQMFIDVLLSIKKKLSNKKRADSNKMLSPKMNTIERTDKGMHSFRSSVVKRSAMFVVAAVVVVSCNFNEIHSSIKTRFVIAFTVEYPKATQDNKIRASLFDRNIELQLFRRNRFEPSSSTTTSTITPPQAPSTGILSSGNYTTSEVAQQAVATTNGVDGSTFGNLVLQMQKKEEAAIRASKRRPGDKQRQGEGYSIKDQVLELDPISGQEIRHSFIPETNKSPSEDNNKNRGGSFVSSKKIREDTVPVIDVETAKELDDSVSFPTGSKEFLVGDMTILPLNPLYTSVFPSLSRSSSSSTSTNQTSTTNVPRRNSIFRRATSTKIAKDNTIFVDRINTIPELPYSRHYLTRIERDRRQLAVSIGTSIDTVEQWRTFCSEGGGIYPILETIREGARVVGNAIPFSATGTVNVNNDVAVEWNGMVGSTTRSRKNQNNNNVKTDAIAMIRAYYDYQEEVFQAACTACRCIRDLCAISPEIAAVITDSILRTNAAWTGGALEDFRTLLRYSSDYTAEKQLEEDTLSQLQDRSSRRGRIRMFINRNKNRKRTINNIDSARFLARRRYRRDTRFRCKLYVTQLLLAMSVASDDAVGAIRATDGLTDAIVACSSYALKEQTRRWLRYPGEMIKWIWRRNKDRMMMVMKTSKTVTKTTAAESTSADQNGVPTTNEPQQQEEQQRIRRPFLEAGNVSNDLNGSLQRNANQLLAAIGYNKWIPKTPGQRGLRVLCLDGGGSRGMSAITAVNYIMESIGGGSADVADTFDMIVGTSTGGIISFLVGLKKESSARAMTRYQQLISKIFIKSALSTPLMLFTTATYDESHFMSILTTILQEKSMLDSRADPRVPLVCCLTSKMSSTPTHVALFRNYNYASGELADPFTIDPDRAREDLDIPLEIEHKVVRTHSYPRKVASTGSPGIRTSNGGSRHPGSFRVLQRYALRASTAAPTVFKPVMMGGEMYCDGGIVASNPTAVAIHEARTVFPNIPIELVVSVGTGAFLEEKSAPRIGWDGIIGQIVNSATDAEQIHHILEDIFGSSSSLFDTTKGASRILTNKSSSSSSSAVSKLQYFRFNPVIGRPDEFPIDVTDPEKLAKLRQITVDYLKQPEQQEKIEQIGTIVNGREHWLKRLLNI